MSTAVLSQTEAPASPALRPRNDVAVLHGVTWEQYLEFRDDPDNRGLRMYYSEGVLLLMSTGWPHGRIGILLSRLITDWSFRNEMHILTAGRWTMQRATIKKGLEADNCYYISSLPRVEGKKNLNLESDPPPDLAIEVVITTYSAHKFSIYAGLGVSEIWIWRGDGIDVFRLRRDGTYEPAESEELPDFPRQAAVDAINSCFDQSDLKVIEAFRSADPSYLR